MLVVCETTDATCKRVEDELVLVGLEVHLHPGDRETVDSEMDAPWDAIVLVRDDGRHVIWARHGRPASAVEAVEVAPNAEESRDSVALRSAELVRAELLPENNPPPSSEESSQGSALGPRPAFALTTGPALLASSYGGVTVGWTGDVSYWFERFSLGVFATGALVPTPWRPAEKELNQQQLTAGLVTKGTLVRALTDRFDLMLAGGVGARTQWLLSRSAPGPMDDPQFRAVAMALALKLELEAVYSFSPWFALGGALGGTLGIPLSFPEPSDDLKKPASDALRRADDQKQPDGLLQASVLVTLRF